MDASPTADLLSHPVAGLLIKASLVLLVGLVVNAFLARSTAGTRHLVLTATLAGVLLMPIFTLLMPTLELAWLPAVPADSPVVVAKSDEATRNASASQSAVDLAQANRSGTTSEETTESSTVAASLMSARTRLRVQTGLLFVYVLGIVVILSGPLVGIYRLWRIRRDVDALPEGQRWDRVIEGLRATPLVSRRVIVACSSAVPVPMTWGVLRPVVLLPLEAEEWPANERRHALLHELSHVKRLDWFVQMMGRLVCALYWFHPLVWITMRRLNLEAERACDDNVLLAGARASRYADQLLELARRVNLPSLSTFGAVTLARRHQLWVRIDSILDHTVRRSPMTLTRTLSVALITVATLLAFGSLSVVPAGQEERESQDRNRSLMSSVARGDHDAARAMLDRGVDPDEGLRGHGTPLILAAGSGDMKMVQLLLSRGADVNHVAEPLGRKEPYRTALATASWAGHLEIVNLLLENGAHVDAAPPGDPTPLMTAAEGRHREIVDLLIDHGANVNRVVKGDGTPLIAAARGGSPEVIERLLEHGADPDQWVEGDENALFHAIRSGDPVAVQSLIDAGVDVNEIWDGDGTSLIVAAREGREEVVDMLLAAGAEPNEGVTGDGTALIMAAKRGEYRVASRLIRAGADTNGSVEGDGNPLIMAARGGHLDVVQLLLDSGAGVDNIVPGDENALIQASGQGHLDVVELLVDAGADVNARVDAGREFRTPLGQATRNGHPEVIELLKAHGAR